jgi:hypothetical protein
MPFLPVFQTARLEPYMRTYPQEPHYIFILCYANAKPDSEGATQSPSRSVMVHPSSTIFKSHPQPLYSSEDSMIIPRCYVGYFVVSLQALLPFFPFSSPRLFNTTIHPSQTLPPFIHKPYFPRHSTNSPLFRKTRTYAPIYRQEAEHKPGSMGRYHD